MQICHIPLYVCLANVSVSKILQYILYSDWSHDIGVGLSAHEARLQHARIQNILY